MEAAQLRRRCRGEVLECLHERVVVVREEMAVPVEHYRDTGVTRFAWRSAWGVPRRRSAAPPPCGEGRECATASGRRPRLPGSRTVVETVSAGWGGHRRDDSIAITLVGEAPTASRACSPRRTGPSAPRTRVHPGMQPLLSCRRRRTRSSLCSHRLDQRVDATRDPFAGRLGHGNAPVPPPADRTRPPPPATIDLRGMLARGTTFVEKPSRCEPIR